MPLAAAEPAAAPEEPPPPPPPCLDGIVSVRWADMEARLACADGKLDSARVDEELALSFVFPRCEIELCTEAPRGVDMRTAAWGACAAKDTYGVFFGLVPGATYWALVREHPEEAAKAEAARALVAAEGAAVVAARAAAAAEAEDSGADARLLAQGEQGVSGLHVEQPGSARGSEA